MWKKPNVFITLPTGETKKISNPSDTPTQEENNKPEVTDGGKKSKPFVLQKFIDVQPPPKELSPEEAMEIQKRVEAADAFMEHIAFGEGEI